MIELAREYVVALAGEGDSSDPRDRDAVWEMLQTTASSTAKTMGLSSTVVDDWSELLDVAVRTGFIEAEEAREARSAVALLFAPKASLSDFYPRLPTLTGPSNDDGARYIETWLATNPTARDIRTRSSVVVKCQDCDLVVAWILDARNRHLITRSRSGTFKLGPAVSDSFWGSQAWCRSRSFALNARQVAEAGRSTVLLRHADKAKSKPTTAVP
jgi:hypothetical protein